MAAISDLASAAVQWSCVGAKFWNIFAVEGQCYLVLAKPTRVLTKMLIPDTINNENVDARTPVAGTQRKRTSVHCTLFVSLVIFCLHKFTFVIAARPEGHTCTKNPKRFPHIAQNIVFFSDFVTFKAFSNTERRF